jgi:hypothetical protein
VGKLFTAGCLILYAVYLLLVPVWWGTPLDGPLPSLSQGPGAAAGAASSSSISSISSIRPSVLSRLSAAAAASSRSQVVLTSAPPPRDILVLYVFAYTDPEYYRNLAYFVAEAIQGDTRAQYYIAVQKVQPVEVRQAPWVCRAARRAEMRAGPWQ